MPHLPRIPFLPGDESCVTIAPYMEASFVPHTLALLWKALDDNHLTSYLWSDGKPISLNEFIRFFAPLENRLLFLPVYTPSTRYSDDAATSFAMDHIMGLMWVDNIKDHHANGHFLFFRHWWGGWPEVAIRKALDVVFHPPLDLSVIICQANAHNHLALGLWKRLGVHRLGGEVPGWYLHPDGAHPAAFGYLSKDDFYGSNK